MTRRSIQACACNPEPEPEHREALKTSPHHPDGDTAQVLPGDISILDLRSQTRLLQQLQQSFGVSRRALRRRRRDPVHLHQQRMSSAVDLRGHQQLADGRVEVLLVVLVLVERLPHLRWDMFCTATETAEKKRNRRRKEKMEEQSSAPSWFTCTNNS